MSEAGDIDDLFEEFFKLAQQVFQQSAESVGYQNGIEPLVVRSGEPDEIILGPREITYLLEVPGYKPEDFLVSVLDDTIEVKTSGFILRRKLGSTVYPESAATTYRNGILSVRMKRRDS